ncbi:MAG TPA: ribonuclease E inhibitor RraB [Kofleriaceae bacterium]|jgi:regulator of RNase E activity RraB
MSNASYPNDADGDALRRIESDGIDTSRPIRVDFMVAAPDRSVAEDFATLALKRGYKTDIDAEGDEWTVYCSKVMLVTYDSVVQAQRELDELARPYGAHSDGWGTFGEDVARDNQN